MNHALRTTRSTLLAALAVSTALALSACGSSNDSSPTAASPAASATAGATAGSTGGSASGTVSAEHNDADITFINAMSPHHEGAVAMAQLAATRAGNAEVKALAGRIAAAQGPELDRMTAMAAAWNVEMMAGDHGMTGGSMSMDIAVDTAALEPLSGTAFDREFLTRMIAHHEGALPMARADLSDGVNPQAKALAQSIVTAQEAEILLMEQLLTQL